MSRGCYEETASVDFQAIPGSDEVDPVVHDGFAEPAIGRGEAGGERVDVAGDDGRSAAGVGGRGDERRSERVGEVVVEPGDVRPPSTDVVGTSEAVEERGRHRRGRVLSGVVVVVVVVQRQRERLGGSGTDSGRRVTTSQIHRRSSLDIPTQHRQHHHHRVACPSVDVAVSMQNARSVVFGIFLCMP